MATKNEAAAKAAKTRRINKMCDDMCAGYGSMPEEMQMLFRDMAMTYCWFAVTCDDLQKKIDREGVLIETEKGPKENPAVGVLHKMSARKHEYFSKIQTAQRRVTDDEVDDIQAFLKMGS